MSPTGRGYDGRREVALRPSLTSNSQLLLIWSVSTGTVASRPLGADAVLPNTGPGYVVTGVCQVMISVPDSYADVVERLCGEFDGRVPLPVVPQIVRQ